MYFNRDSECTIFVVPSERHVIISGLSLHWRYIGPRDSGAASPAFGVLAFSALFGALSFYQ